MFDIQYLMSEWHNKGTILPSCLKHVLKKGMKILGVSVNWKWDRLDTYWLALITRKRTNKIEAPYILEGTVLENVDSIKYLGVTIRHNLRWNTHISNMCTKTNRMLGILRQNLYHCPQDEKQAVCKGCVHLILDNDSCVWCDNMSCDENVGSNRSIFCQIYQNVI